jgi:glucose uptake protein GlcU
MYIQKNMNDPITDAGFIMSLIGLITIVLGGLILLPNRETLFTNKIAPIGSIIIVLGAIIILVGIY